MAEAEEGGGAVQPYTGAVAPTGEGSPAPTGANLTESPEKWSLKESFGKLGYEACRIRFGSTPSKCLKKKLRGCTWDYGQQKCALSKCMNFTDSQNCEGNKQRKESDHIPGRIRAFLGPKKITVVKCVWLGPESDGFCSNASPKLLLSEHAQGVEQLLRAEVEIPGRAEGTPSSFAFTIIYPSDVETQVQGPDIEFVASSPSGNPKYKFRLFPDSVTPQLGTYTIKVSEISETGATTPLLTYAPEFKKCGLCRDVTNNFEETSSCGNCHESHACKECLDKIDKHNPFDPSKPYSVNCPVCGGEIKTASLERQKADHAKAMRAARIVAPILVPIAPIAVAGIFVVATVSLPFILVGACCWKVAYELLDRGDNIIDE